MIKFIAMDFDNTLISYESGKERISPALINFFERYIENDFHAGIVSGREKWDFQECMLARGETWGKNFPDYIISREAYIYKIEKGKYIEFTDYNNMVSKKISNTIRKVAAHIETILHTFEKSGIIINKWFIYSDFAVEIHVDGNYNYAVNVLNNVLTELQIKNTAVHRNKNMITIYDKYAGKGNTLKVLTQRLDIKPCEVLAIGDSYNDLSMIDGQMGFVGACVGNADENLKKIVLKNGGYVGKGTAHDGVLDIIVQLKDEGKIIC